MNNEIGNEFMMTQYLNNNNNRRKLTPKEQFLAYALNQTNPKKYTPENIGKLMGVCETTIRTNNKDMENEIIKHNQQIQIAQQDETIAQQGETINSLNARLAQYEWVCPCGYRLPLSTQQCPCCGTINIK